jgi:hypothetical protein
MMRRTRETLSRWTQDDSAGLRAEPLFVQMTPTKRSTAVSEPLFVQITPTKRSTAVYHRRRENHNAVLRQIISAWHEDKHGQGALADCIAAYFQERAQLSFINESWMTPRHAKDCGGCIGCSPNVQCSCTPCPTYERDKGVVKGNARTRCVQHLN